MSFVRASSTRHAVIRSTVACVIQHQNRFLMVEERPTGSRGTVFNQPAGHVEPGEGPISAILREVQEETAWQVTLTGYLGLYVFCTDNGLTFHSHGFIATPETLLNTAIDSDIVNTHWLTLEDIQVLDTTQRLRSPLVLRRIMDANEGHHFPLSVIQE